MVKGSQVWRRRLPDQAFRSTAAGGADAGDHAAAPLAIRDWTGKVVVNLDKGLVSVDDKPMLLTGMEYSVLELLSLHKGVTPTKVIEEQLLYGGMDEPGARIIDGFCRQSAESACSGIGTMRGRGYVDPSGLPVVQGPPVQWTVRRKVGVVVAVASGENHRGGVPASSALRRGIPSLAAHARDACCDRPRTPKAFGQRRQDHGMRFQRLVAGGGEKAGDQHIGIDHRPGSLMCRSAAMIGPGWAARQALICLQGSHAAVFPSAYRITTRSDVPRAGAGANRSPDEVW